MSVLTAVCNRLPNIYRRRRKIYARRALNLQKAPKIYANVPKDYS